MAHSHYVMDLYYQEGRDPDRFRREVLRIEAHGDDEALTEGRRIDAWRQTAFFVLRAIQNSTRNRERQIFDSRSEHPVVADVTEGSEAANSQTAPDLAEARE